LRFDSCDRTITSNKRILIDLDTAPSFQIRTHDPVFKPDLRRWITD